MCTRHVCQRNSLKLDVYVLGYTVQYVKVDQIRAPLNARLASLLHSSVASRSLQWLEGGGIRKCKRNFFEHVSLQSGALRTRRKEQKGGKEKGRGVDEDTKRMIKQSLGWQTYSYLAALALGCTHFSRLPLDSLLI